MANSDQFETNFIGDTAIRPVLLRTADEMREWYDSHPKKEGLLGFVPTMGALHAGHRSLLEIARRECDLVVASIFVNPTQFGPNEDFSRYPRTFEADAAICAAAGVDAIFLPSSEVMYPPGFATFVEVGGVSELWEGAARPGHFRGVTTVVLKLFELVRPNIAYFGMKDYQQQLLIRRMVLDLNIPIQIRSCAIVRESDGLAMSSRNRYLSEEERSRAVAISQALNWAREELANGTSSLDTVRRGMIERIEAAGLEVEYAAICDPLTLVELQDSEYGMVLLVAARLGSVRLIDNMQVTLDEASLGGQHQPKKAESAR